MNAVRKDLSPVALINLDSICLGTLRRAFREVGIRCETVFSQSGATLYREIFSGCVLDLNDPAAANIILAARNADPRRRLIIYGISSDERQALHFMAHYGIDAVFSDLNDLQTVRQLINVTCLLMKPDKNLLQFKVKQMAESIETFNPGSAASFFERMDALSSHLLEQGHTEAPAEAQAAAGTPPARTRVSRKIA